MAQYQLTAGATIMRRADSASIPIEPANSDYQAYLAWLALGNTPDPYVPPAALSPTDLTFDADPWQSIGI